VSTLIKWFPDRPGLATGMAIMGFGGGALIASPVSTALLKLYDPNSGAKGWVASGESVGKLFLTLAVVYLAYMMFGAFTIKVPAEGWTPAGFDPAKVGTAALVTTENVSARNAVKTRQFWLVWVALFCNVTAGIGLLEQAAPMIQDFFRQPDGTSLASAAVAAGFVGLLSIGNMSGRFAWSATSDVTGRKRIYMVYLGVGWRWPARPPPSSTSRSRSSSSPSTAAGSRPPPPTCGTSSARSRSAPSTAAS
jgi:MFS family permease